MCLVLFDEMPAVIQSLRAGWLMSYRRTDHFAGAHESLICSRICMVSSSTTGRSLSFRVTVFPSDLIVGFCSVGLVLDVHASPALMLSHDDTKVKDRDSRLLRAKELLQSNLASKDQELEAALVRLCVCLCGCFVFGRWGAVCRWWYFWLTVSGVDVFLSVLVLSVNNSCTLVALMSRSLCSYTSASNAGG